MRGISYVRRGELVRRRRRKRGETWDTLAECGVFEGPDPRLADFLPELIRHAPRPPPVDRTTDATASALEQDAECGSPGSGHAQQQGAALSSSHDAAPLQPHLPDESVEDSTSSVRIADGVSVMRANSMNSLFSFSPSGDFTWWSGTIPGLLACCALASMIIIGVCSSQRRAPAVLALMSAQQCSFLSSLQPPVAYMAWMNTCGAAHRGYAYPCMSQVDCVVLGPRCAPPSVLPQLLCVNTGDWEGETWDTLAECGVFEGPDPRLADFLPELIRHAPRPPPVDRTTDATASALEQDAECGSPGSGHAVPPGCLWSQSRSTLRRLRMRMFSDLLRVWNGRIEGG
ncbi:hypothetical protein CGC20_11200 [Leishmania donovani]|uniref:Uncharacterized protein n=1 Tax=Leishmania donovani TaxID=5661 RepID=A0A504Y4R6_LEIDO|nr:hypothetical protein CGC20_11200 [Leishmania donovani]